MIEFQNYHQNNNETGLAERLNPVFWLPKTTKTKDKIIITPSLLNEHCEVTDTLDKCSHLALSQLLRDKNLILMTDASFQAADYEVLNPIENLPQHAKPMLQWHTPPKHLLPHKKNVHVRRRNLSNILGL